MAQIRLVPSTYTRSSTNRVNVTNEANMYYNTDHTGSYARIRGRNSANNTYYAFIHGFNFDDVPSDAIVNSFTVKIKAYRNSYLSSLTTYYLRLASTPSNNSVISNTTLSSALATGATGSVYTFPNGSLTWEQVKGYGSDFSIEIPLRSTSSSYPYAYVFGAEILVDYTIPVYHNVSITNNSDEAVVTPSTQQSVLEGNDLQITINNVEEGTISVTDNNTDVTNSLIHHTGGLNTASVDSVAGASYGFTFDGQYYKSQNAGYASSYALCRLNITASTECTLTLYLINSGEATYDYGLVGNLDTALSASSGVTSDSYYWIGNTSDKNSTSEQAVTMTIPSGTHFVDFKYRKDNYTNSGNDALWFRYDLPAGSAGGYYTYTISNITADHTITVTDANVTKYAVNASSSYSGATVSPATQEIREGRNAVVNIAVNNLYEIVVKDNGTDVTGSLVQNSTGYTYTVSNIQAVHNITVQEATKYLVTTESNYAKVTITPESANIYSGQSTTLTIQGPVDNLILKDNGVDVTSSIVESGDLHTYTISNISQAHVVIAYAETDYMKINGAFKEVKTIFKKVNGDWVEITKQAFDAEIPNNVLIYGGNIRTITVGEVVKNTDTYSIVVNDGALGPGTYKLVYEDEGKGPIDNVGKITDFTIS